MSEHATPADHGPETLYYDGRCGLCRRWIKFTLRRDPDGRRFIFAPLQSDWFRDHVSAEQRDGLPDSIVIQKHDGELLTRSAAMLHIMSRLGGFWRALAGVMKIVPRAVRDWGYDLVARVRHKLCKRPDDVCPVMPPGLRDRFRF